MKHFFSLMRRGPVAGLLLILLWLAGPAARAQAPAWQSAVAPTRTTTQYGGYTSSAQATAIDAQGNVYLAGLFDGTVSFGNSTLTSAGGWDGFVAKWSRTTGNFVWAQRVGGSATDQLVAVAVSAAGVFVAGSFNSPTATVGSVTLSNAGGNSLTGDVVVAKLTNAGSVEWVQRAGGSDDDVATALAAAGTSVYVAGRYGAAGAGFGGLVITGSGTSEGFLTKLEDAGSSGSFALAQRLGGLGQAEAAALAVAGTSVYLAGGFAGRATFGSTGLTSVGSSDAFVSKATDIGTACVFAWAQRAGGSGPDGATALAVTGTTLYLAGTIGSPAADMGSQTLTTTGQAAFVAKLTDQGTAGPFGWAQQTRGLGIAQATGLAASAGHIYLTGWFGGTSVAFGSTILTNTPQPGPNPMPPYSDGFLALLSDNGATGAFSGAELIGGFGTERSTAVAVGGATVSVVGSFNSTVTLGSQTITSPFLELTAFLATLTDPTLLATTAAQSTLSFTLAPNPARAAATVQLPAVPGAPTATLTLTDALGRTVRTETVALPTAGLRHELALGGLAPGVYAVQVRAGAVTATQRLVVE